MEDFLRKAFTLAANSIEMVHNTYDRLGVLAMRAVMEDGFFSLNPQGIESPVLRRAVHWAQWGIDKAQDALLDGIYSKTRKGDYGPQPDIKPGLIKFAQTGLSMLPRLGITPQSAVVLLTAGAAMAAVYLSYQMGLSTTVNAVENTLSPHKQNEPVQMDARNRTVTPSVQPSAF